MGASAEVADIIIDSLHEGAEAPPRAAVSLVIGGCARAGKSLLAQRLAAELDHVFLAGDMLRDLYRIPEVPAERNRLRQQFMLRILRGFRGGLIVEGADLVMRDNVRNGSRRPSLELLRRIRREGLAEVAVAGNADTSVADKVRALEAWRATGNCWTTGAAHAERYAEPAALEKLARGTIERSRVLREKAEAADIPYLEIRPDAFEADIATHLTTLRARLAPG